MAESEQTKPKTGKERSKENLRPIQKGEKRNPKGSSKLARQRCAVRQWLDAHPGEREKIAAALARMAKKGNVQAIRETLDRDQGKVPDKLSMTSEIDVRVTYREEGEGDDGSEPDA